MRISSGRDSNYSLILSLIVIMWRQFGATIRLSTAKCIRSQCQLRQKASSSLSVGERIRVTELRGGATFSPATGDPYCNRHRKLSTNSTAYKYCVYIAVGSNLGDRFANIRRALQLLSGDVRLVRTSLLHETAPMYVTDQPAFLNGAVQVETNLEPLELLCRIKDAEGKLGRDFTGTRNGPRPVDLDILCYKTISADPSVEGGGEMLVVNTTELTLPHPRIQERDFVLIPLIEVAGRGLSLPGSNRTLGEALGALQKPQHTTGDEAQPSAVRVLPLPRGRMLYFNETIIMGILNATPDSFSDGGRWTASVDAAVQRALTMVHEGAGIIDIGGESTRPGALEVAIEEELRRTIPIIQGIRKGAF
jgi:2-amino-4-hydroxy-6-hydroxymethyldihydropteridine diphosphokinase